MNIKCNSVYQTLIVIVLLGYCISCSKDSPAPVSTNPQLYKVDKNYVINGDIITITGKNFSQNYNGISQIIATNLADTSQVYLSVLSRTSTQIVAVARGSGSGTLGSYRLSYNSKPDTSKAKIYPGLISVNVSAPATGQFSASSTFTANSANVGTTASFGTKNGSINKANYIVKLIGYDYATGVSTEYSADVVGVTAKGFDGLMDLVSFTVPNVAAGEYHVKVTYVTNSSTVVAGWNASFFVN